MHWATLARTQWWPRTRRSTCPWTRTLKYWLTWYGPPWNRTSLHWRTCRHTRRLTDRWRRPGRRRFVHRTRSRLRNDHARRRCLRPLRHCRRPSCNRTSLCCRRRRCRHRSRRCCCCWRLRRDGCRRLNGRSWRSGWRNHGCRRLRWWRSRNREGWSRCCDRNYQAGRRRRRCWRLNRRLGGWSRSARRRLGLHRRHGYGTSWRSCRRCGGRSSLLLSNCVQYVAWS